MNRSQMRKEIRALADDITPNPYLWSEDFLNMRIDEARKQASRRAKLFVTSEEQVCRMLVKANVPFSTLDPRIINIRQIYKSDTDVPICKVHHEDLNDRFPGWRTQTGETLGYCMGVEKRKIRWLMTPSADITIRLLAVVEADCWDNDTDEDPYFAERYQYELMSWVLYRMYSKRDSDQYAPDLAKDYYDQFEAEFGPPSRAVEEQWVLENQGFTDDGAR